MKFLDLQALRDNPKIVIDSDHKWGRQYRFTNTNKYCSKFLELTEPDVKGSEHRHKEKEETWLILDGIVYTIVSGKLIKMKVGGDITIYQGVIHQFWAKVPSLILETSTYDDDDDTYKRKGDWYINRKGELYISRYKENNKIHEKMQNDFRSGIRRG